MTERRRRYLRPGWLVPVGDRLWVVDEVQPVAVVLDVATGAPVTTVSWAGQAAPARDSWQVAWEVRPADDGLWVQQPGGPLLLVGQDGVRSGHISGGRTLGAVSTHGAWCLPDPPVQDIATTQDAPPLGRGGFHQLFVAHPARTTAMLLVDAAVHAAQSHDGDLYLEVETGRWSRRNLGMPTSWSLEPHTAWLRLPAGEPVPDRLSLATHGSDPPPHVAGTERDGGRLHAPWLPPSGQDNPRWGPCATDPGPVGVDWWAGWVGHGRDRRVAVRARESGTTVERHQIDLGPGAAGAAVATAGWLWLALQQSGPRPSYRSLAASALVRLRADDGSVETVLPADAVDVTEHCWSMPHEPVETADYVAFWRNRFTNLDHFWTHPDGRRSPLAGGLSDSRVHIVGRWPDTALHITFAYAPRPGRRLRRVLPLFDELGRQTSPENADIHLMENLDTGNIPDESAPGADHLDI